MTTTIFLLFILYTIACCMDGPDLKPRWKRWLGMKLEGYADRLKPIHYCVDDKCKFYNRAKYDFPLLQKQYEEVIGNIAKMNALNSHQVFYVSDYDIKDIEQGFILGESELYEAHINEEIAKRNGIPKCQLPFDMTVDGIIYRTKERCVYSILEGVKPFITIEEDKESHWPNIIVRGMLHAGVKRK